MQIASTVIVTRPQTAAVLPPKQNFIILTTGIGDNGQELQK